MTHVDIRRQLRALWSEYSAPEREEIFEGLPAEDAGELLLDLATNDQIELLSPMVPGQRAAWLRVLPPDEVADLLQEVDDPSGWLEGLSESARREVEALLAYREDHAGGLMSPRFARVRPDLTAEQALAYLRGQAGDKSETIYTLYVLDSDQKLLGVLSLRDLIAQPLQTRISDIMTTDLVTAPSDLDQEHLSRLFVQNRLMAIPVVDADGRMQGVVTVDDIVDVVQEEATEDIQKLGGQEALDMPYLRTGFAEMTRKRAGWLTALFLGEMLTATAMGYFEEEIARAVVLALFVPLIISSGGNSGSQATTLVIRAMALGELRLADWWRVARRELITGVCLGLILGLVGSLRISLWQHLFGTYGTEAVRIGLTVACSLVGVVTFGTLAGSMLPFLLRRIGVDPASASAPFVATLVDVSGLVIYFSVARVILGI